MTQIEPITIMVGSEEKKGEYLLVEKPFPFSINDIMNAKILDKDGNVLFTSNIVVKNMFDAARYLGLKIKLK